MTDDSRREDVDLATASDATTGELITRLTQEVSKLVQDELRLAQAELSDKAKQAGVGAGLFGAASIMALYAIGVLLTAAVLALSLLVEAWLAALIVGIVLLVMAGITALVGKRGVGRASPLAPTETIESIKRDVDAVKNGRHQ